MSTAGRDNAELPTATLAGLLLVLAAVAAPHVTHLPPWVTAVVIACGLWRLTIARRRTALPSAWLRIVLVLSAAVAIIASYGEVLGRDAGVALLILMAAFKLLEMRRKRDTLVLILLGYFLVITQFLYSQTIPTALYMLVVVWVTTVMLIDVTRPANIGMPWRHAVLAGKMLAQSLPIMIILFILFPRVPGPLWGVPESALGNVTGLSEEMSPGSIGDLVQSDAVAFRVYFDGEPPPHAQRYWRGPVLTAYDGRTWRHRPRILNDPDELEFAALGGAVTYDVVLEPHNRRWLFGLELTTGIPSEAQRAKDGELFTEDRVRERMRYRAVSHGWYALEPSRDMEQLERYRHLPADVHPKAQTLAAEWRATADTPQDIIDAAREFFESRPFTYTLDPPVLNDDPVDEFLFDTQAGFCEHYAGAFVALMRSADIPARVVTGYLGGEINPAGGYMIVRQSDAHAWAEVWLDGDGWVRVDPTGVVSPDRIEAGLGAALDDPDALPRMARPDGGWLGDLRLQWDHLMRVWDDWIVAYGPSVQQRLLARMGVDSLAALGTAMGGALLAVGGAIAALVLLRRRRPPTDGAQAAYAAFCRRLERIGLRRRPGEGPVDFAGRVARQRPDMAAEVELITRLYVDIRYRGRYEPPRVARLKRLVARLRPARRAPDWYNNRPHRYGKAGAEPASPMP